MNKKRLFKAIVNRLYTVLVKSYLTLRGCSYGKHLFIMNSMPKLEIEKGATLKIGNNFTVNSNSLETAWYCKSCIVVKNGATLDIGNNVGMNGALIYCTNSIKIGDYANIGGGTRVFDTNFHPVDWEIRRDNKRFLECVTKPIIIEDDVFIGTNCIICKGVTIGARAVIAAGSVVTKSIPADCIAGGNPCKVIKTIKQ